MDQSYTFLTTDYGDHIVAIPDQFYTKYIYISVDHGHSFWSISVTEDRFMLLHLSKVNFNKDIILLSTAKASYKSSYSLVLSLDFSRLLEKKCSWNELQSAYNQCSNEED